MKVNLYIDLPNDNFLPVDMVYAFGKPTSQKMDGYSRYKIEVDLPVHHFKPVSDRTIQAVTLGKEEE